MARERSGFSMSASILARGGLERRPLAGFAETLEATEVVTPIEIVGSVDLVAQLLRVDLNEGEAGLSAALTEPEGKGVVFPVGVTPHTPPFDEAIGLQARDLHLRSEFVGELKCDHAADLLRR